METAWGPGHLVGMVGAKIYLIGFVGMFCGRRDRMIEGQNPGHEDQNGIGCATITVLVAVLIAGIAVLIADIVVFEVGRPKF